ncbi:hypothetical protein IC006_2306 [Sulfuracidifex tepidarius]|uniref:Uncharacterized protein n=2 Tax=Sulfuracidifex tepidarius TaxID=1294262 RepID=A0A510DXL2_9CREN|nr:hypothetical protein IC006_2306 [Sulfuracidifex tepidarius]
MIYEGYIYVLSICRNDPSPECLQGLWRNKVQFYFTGNDVKHTLKRISAQIPQCKQIDAKLESLAECLSLITPDLEVSMKVNEDVFVGHNLEMKENWLSFQIMKVDRYMGISSMESGLMKKQVTCFTDLSGAYLFFLGLISSSVVTIGNDYYFLLFDTSQVPDCLANPLAWFSVKDQLKADLRNALKKVGRVSEEIISLESLLDSSVISAMMSNRLERVNLRLLKISSEGNTYKVYNDFPITMLNMRIYQNMKLVKSLQKLVNLLIIPASDFLNGRDKKGDGYHAYMALKYVYMFLTSDNSTYLNMAVRELHEANKANEKGGYLRWITYLIMR